jgi:hypothetical protein
MSDLIWLQEWYRHQCDGHWEHQYGIKIDTLDNPGWQVKIDGLKFAPVPERGLRLDEEISETSWIKCSLEGGVFLGYSDPEGLSRIVQTFRQWVQKP